MSYETIIFEKKRNIATVTLNRPDKLNSLTPTTMKELKDVIQVINEDNDIRSVVITGSGDRAFSTGFDMFETKASDTLGWEKLVRTNYETLMDIWRMNKPTIAAVNGYSMAAGVSLAMICDIVIASDKAIFGEPEVRHFALSPLLILPWIGTNQKLINYHYFTGDPIDAELAKELGMVAKIVPGEELQAEAERMAERIAKVPAFPVEVTKASLRRTYEIMGMANAFDHHRVMDTMVLSAHGIKEKDDLMEILDVEGPKAFFAARDGRFKE